MVLQRVFRALGCSIKGKQSYMQTNAGNTTAIWISVAHRTPTGILLRVAFRRKGIADNLAVFGR